MKLNYWFPSPHIKQHFVIATAVPTENSCYNKVDRSLKDLVDPPRLYLISPFSQLKADAYRAKRKKKAQHLMLPRTLHLLSSRAFTTTTTRCTEEIIMNRHSRVVTQPKVQGASQVDIAKYFSFNVSISYIFRPCSMLQMKSIQTMTSTRPWSAWRAYGKFFVILMLQFLTRSQV